MALLYIEDGSHNASPGHKITIIRAMPCKATKGIIERYISPMSISGGTTAFIMNKLNPKGGVMYAISIFMVNSTPNHTGSKFNALTSGTKIGVVSIMMPAGSKNIPKIKNVNCIANKIHHRDK